MSRKTTSQTISKTLQFLLLYLRYETDVNPYRIKENDNLIQEYLNMTSNRKLLSIEDIIVMLRYMSPSFFIDYCTNTYNTNRSNPKCAISWSSSSRKAIWSDFLSSEWTRPPCKRCSKFAFAALWTRRTTWIERAMCRPSRFSRFSRKAFTTSAAIGFNSEHWGLDWAQLFRSIGPRGTVHGAMRDRELVLFVL